MGRAALHTVQLPIGPPQPAPAAHNHGAAGLTQQQLRRAASEHTTLAGRCSCCSLRTAAPYRFLHQACWLADKAAIESTFQGLRMGNYHEQQSNRC